MKRFLITALVLIPIFISACQVIVDSSIQLQDEFVANADEFRLKPPGWRFRNEHFEADLGDYRAARVKRFSHSPNKSTLTGISHEDYTLFNWLFMARLQIEGYARKEYEIRRVRGFSYAIVDASDSIKVSSTCKTADLLKKEVVKRTYFFGKKGKESLREGEGMEDWISTALSCELLQGNRSWRLNLVSVNDQPAQVTVESDGEAFIFEQITGVERVLEDRSGRQTTRRFDPQQSDEYLGALIKQDDKQIGAISFTYPYDKVWIAKHLATEVREVLLGIGYGLILFDWLSDDWREQ